MWLPVWISFGLSLAGLVEVTDQSSLQPSKAADSWGLLFSFDSGAEQDPP